MKKKSISSYFLNYCHTFALPNIDRCFYFNPLDLMSEVVGILCQRSGFQARSSQTLFRSPLSFPYAATVPVANF